MEKLCLTHYVIIGNTLDIKYLYKKLQSLSKGKIPALDRIAKAFCPEWNHSSISGDFFGLQLENDRKITFSVTTDKMTEPLIWLHICKQYFSTKCYYYSQMYTLGQFRTNDVTGKYFPHRYMVSTNAGEIKAVVSQGELHKEVCRIVPFSEPFTSFKEFGKAVSGYKSVLRIFDILVVDNRGKCISQSYNLISNWLQ